MPSFVQACEKILKSSSVVLENFDDTKKVYGYSLKTFSREEIELFEAFANSVIKKAEKNKQSLRNDWERAPKDSHKRWLATTSTTDDIEYYEIKKSFVNNQNVGWRNFYSAAIIYVGVPSLSYNDGEFYLDFANHLPLVDRRVPESKNWKKHIIAALKFSLTDSFFNYLDCVDPKNNPMDVEMKEFFDQRESKIHIKNVYSRLPELDGLFEANKLEDQAMLKLTFSNLSPLDKELLIKYVQILDDPNDEVRVISDNVVQYVQHDIGYEWCKKESKKTYPAFKHSMLIAMLHMPDIQLTNRGIKSFISRIFKNCKIEVVKTEYEEITNRLPELEGIFEQKENPKNYIVEVTFKKSSDEYDNRTIKTLLIKMKVLQDIYCKVAGSFTETLETFVYKFPQTLGRIKIEEQKKHHEDTFMSYFTQEYNYLVKNVKITPFKVMPEITFKWFDETLYDTYKRLPELEGIFENVGDKEPGVIEFTWNDIKDESHKKTLLSILKNDFLFNGTINTIVNKAQQTGKLNDPYKLLLKSSRTSAALREVVQDGNKITLRIPGVPTDLKTRQISEEFMKSLGSDLNSAMSQIVDFNQRLYPSGFPECWKFTSRLITKYTDLEDRLPEVKGIFEAVELDPDFHLIKEEEEAIEEIAETIQNLFQNYEERIVALMKNLKKSSLELQDEKLNKYIGITHLRNDLRLTVGKLCKKHFEALDKYDQKTRSEKPLYNQYERIFLKPLTGSTAVTRGGVLLKYQDDVFEIVFDTYDYILGEKIVDSKSIESFEVKDYLKKLLSIWLNAITTHNQWYFTKQYSEFRKEKTKIRSVINRLPELEGMFENKNEQPKFVVISSFSSLSQNDKHLLLKILKWRQNHIDHKSKIVEPSNSSVQFITFGVRYNDRDGIKTSYKRMLRIDMDYVFPLMAAQSADEFINKIFENVNISCKEERLHDVENRIPELTGIFETIEDNVFDLVIELTEEDRHGSKTTKQVLEIIASYLQKYNCINMEDTWECKVKPFFQYDIKTDPPTIIFKDIPKSIIQTYTNEMKDTIFFADRTIGSKLWHDHSYVFNTLCIKKIEPNSSSAYLRKVQTRLPELEGVFESKLNQDYSFVATFETTPDLSTHKKLLKALDMMVGFQGANSSSTIKETENGQIVYVMENPVKWDFNDEEDRNKYARVFYNSYKTIKSQLGINVDYTARFKSKYENLVKRLPELEGMFESQGTYPYGLEGFFATSPSTKFQIGDRVRVIDPQNRWRKYQSSKSNEAINKFGKILGYRYVQGAYSKYAVQLANGKVFGIHSHFLRLPTKEEDVTKDVEQRLPELQGMF